MKKIYVLLLSLLFAFAPVFGASTKQSKNTNQARPTQEWFKKSTIYQIHIPLFTQEGTLKKIEEMLEHIKSLGVDIVYLTPVAESDDDTNPEFWSKRQKASKFGNPQNPYRIKDYYKIDPRFGNDDDLKNLVKKAHSLGLKVMLDLVYYHCGPKAKIISMNKNWVICDKDGNIKKGRWTFPELNFDNPELREYMLKNMEYFVEKFDIDGYRTDVELYVPADFWAEGYTRVKKIKPDFIMLAESSRTQGQLDAYDANYTGHWSKQLEKVMLKGNSAKELIKFWKKENENKPIGARIGRCMDNHDTASDVGRGYEHLLGFRAMNAIFVFHFTLDGIPFVYNGNEIANDSAMNMFSTNKYGRNFIAWENAMTEKGRERFELIKTLVVLKKSNPALYNGETTWLETSKPNTIIAFTRTCPEQKTMTIVNLSKDMTDVSVPYTDANAKVILQNGVKFTKNEDKLNLKMRDFGYIILQCK